MGTFIILGWIFGFASAAARLCAEVHQKCGMAQAIQVAILANLAGFITLLTVLRGLHHFKVLQ